MQVASYHKRFAVAFLLAASIALDSSAQAPAIGQTNGSPALQQRQATTVDLYGDPLPTGAVARLGTIRFRTDRGLHSAAHSADGKWLIGISDNEICYWNADDGRLDAAIPIEKQNVQHAAISEDRRWCCTSGFFVNEDRTQHSYTLSVWDLEQRQQKQSIELDRETHPSCVAITSDGALIAIGNERGRVSIYETASGAELLSGSLMEGDMTAIRFSPTDRRIMAIGRNASLTVWDWENGAEPVSATESISRSEGLAISPDGALVAIALDGAEGLEVRRTADWSRVEGIGRIGSFRYLRGMAFSPDSRFLAAADYYCENVSLIELLTGKVIHDWPVRPEHIEHLNFSTDGQWLVAASDWTAAPPRIWNTRTGQPQELTATGHRIAPAWIEFAPDGNSLVTSGDDGTVRFWDGTTGRQVRMASQHPEEQPNRQYNVWIRALALSDDGRFFATSSLDDSVRLWDAATMRQIFRLPGHGRLGGRRELAFSPDGHRLASFGDDMYLRVWDTKTGKALAEHSLQPGGMEIRRDEDGSRSSRPDEMLFMQMGESAFSRDASRMLLSIQSKIYVFDVDTGRELSALEQEAAGFMMSLAISPDGKMLATSRSARLERNQIVEIWRLDEGELKHKLTSPGGSGGPLAFSDDGKLLAVGMRNALGPIRIVSVETGERVAEITGFDSEPRALAFSNDGRLLASSLGNTTVLVWDWRQFQKK
jgi:WD40 repeat protein